MRTFFVKGWNITHGLNSTQIVCLSAFLVLLALVLVLFFLLILYRNILKNLTQALTEAEKIARNSLQNRLKRIDDILTQTPNPAKKHALQIWRAEYKLLIENKFLEQLEFLQKSFLITKLTSPSLKNLHQSKRSLNELKLISQKLYLIYRQTDKIMAWEMLQRDTRIKVRELFNDLKQDIKDVNENQLFNFDHSKMSERKQGIDQALSVINLKIIEGNNLVAEAYQEKTNEQILSLIKLLDLFYHCEKLLNSALPEKIKKIEKRMRTSTLDQMELKKGLSRLAALNKTFIIYKNDIFKSLSALEYEITFQKLSAISEMVSNFENDIQYEEKIKDFMTDNLGFLNQLFVGLGSDLENVKVSIKYNQELGKSIQKLKLQFSELQKQSLSLNREWNEFYNSWSNIKIYQKDYDFFTLEQTLNQLLQQLKIVYQGLNKISKNLKTKNNLREEIDAKIFELRAFLSTSEVIITKNVKIINCEPQKKMINQIYTRLELIENETNDQKNLLNFQSTKIIIEELEKLIEQAFDLKNEIKSKVLLAVLAESIIVYLDRYSNDEKMEASFGTVLEHYENNEWNEVLNLGIYSLQSYRK